MKHICLEGAFDEVSILYPIDLYVQGATKRLVELGQICWRASISITLFEIKKT